MNREMTPVLKSWQFFLSCQNILGQTFLTTLFNRGSRQIYRWCADPDFAAPDGIERNPLDKLRTLFERLHERGRTDVAQAALSMLSNVIGYQTIPVIPCMPDKPTIEAEMLDDYPAILKFHESIMNHESDDAVRYWCDAAKRELDQTLCKHSNKCK